MSENYLPINPHHDVEPKVRVIRYWKTVDLSVGMHLTYDVVPKIEISSAKMTDMLFDKIVEAIKKSGVSWELYEMETRLVESGK